MSTNAKRSAKEKDDRHLVLLLKRPNLAQNKKEAVVPWRPAGYQPPIDTDAAIEGGDIINPAPVIVPPRESSCGQPPRSRSVSPGIQRHSCSGSQFSVTSQHIQSTADSQSQHAVSSKPAPGANMPDVVASKGETHNHVGKVPHHKQGVRVKHVLSPVKGARKQQGYAQQQARQSNDASYTNRFLSNAASWQHSGGVQAPQQRKTGQAGNPTAKRNHATLQKNNTGAKQPHKRFMLAQQNVQAQLFDPVASSNSMLQQFYVQPDVVKAQLPVFNNADHTTGLALAKKNMAAQSPNRPSKLSNKTPTKQGASSYRHRGAQKFSIQKSVKTSRADLSNLLQAIQAQTQQLEMTAKDILAQNDTVVHEMGAATVHNESNCNISKTSDLFSMQDHNSDMTGQLLFGVPQSQTQHTIQHTEQQQEAVGHSMPVEVAALLSTPGSCRLTRTKPRVRVATRGKSGTSHNTAGMALTSASPVFDALSVSPASSLQPCLRRHSSAGGDQAPTPAQIWQPLLAMGLATLEESEPQGLKHQVVQSNDMILTNDDHQTVTSGSTVPSLFANRTESHTASANHHEQDPDVVGNLRTDNFRFLFSNVTSPNVVHSATHSVRSSIQKSPTSPTFPSRAMPSKLRASLLFSNSQISVDQPASCKSSPSLFSKIRRSEAGRNSLFGGQSRFTSEGGNDNDDDAASLMSILSAGFGTTAAVRTSGISPITSHRKRRQRGNNGTSASQCSQFSLLNRSHSLPGCDTGGVCEIEPSATVVRQQFCDPLMVLLSPRLRPTQLVDAFQAAIAQHSPAPGKGIAQPSGSDINDYDHMLKDQQPATKLVNEQSPHTALTAGAAQVLNAIEPGLSDCRPQAEEHIAQKLFEFDICDGASDDRTNAADQHRPRSDNGLLHLPSSDDDADHTSWLTPVRCKEQLCSPALPATAGSAYDVGYDQDCSDITPCRTALAAMDDNNDLAHTPESARQPKMSAWLAAVLADANQACKPKVSGQPSPGSTLWLKRTPTVVEPTLTATRPCALPLEQEVQDAFQISKADSCHMPIVDTRFCIDQEHNIAETVNVTDIEVPDSQPSMDGWVHFWQAQQLEHQTISRYLQSRQTPILSPRGSKALELPSNDDASKSAFALPQLSWTMPEPENLIQSVMTNTEPQGSVHGNSETEPPTVTQGSLQHGDDDVTEGDGVANTDQQFVQQSVINLMDNSNHSSEHDAVQDVSEYNLEQAAEAGLNNKHDTGVTASSHQDNDVCTTENSSLSTADQQTEDADGTMKQAAAELEVQLHLANASQIEPNTGHATFDSPMHASEAVQGTTDAVSDDATPASFGAVLQHDSTELDTADHQLETIRLTVNPFKTVSSSAPEQAVSKALDDLNDEQSEPACSFSASDQETVVQETARIEQQEQHHSAEPDAFTLTLGACQVLTSAFHHNQHVTEIDSPTIGVGDVHSGDQPEQSNAVGNRITLTPDEVPQSTSAWSAIAFALANKTVTAACVQLATSPGHVQKLEAAFANRNQPLPDVSNKARVQQGLPVAPTPKDETTNNVSTAIKFLEPVRPVARSERKQDKQCLQPLSSVFKEGAMRAVSAVMKDAVPAPSNTLQQEIVLMPAVNAVRPVTKRNSNQAAQQHGDTIAAASKKEAATTLQPLSPNTLVATQKPPVEAKPPVAATSNSQVCIVLAAPVHPKGYKPQKVARTPSGKMLQGLETALKQQDEVKQADHKPQLPAAQCSQQVVQPQSQPLVSSEKKLCPDLTFHVTPPRLFKSSIGKAMRVPQQQASNAESVPGETAAVSSAVTDEPPMIQPQDNEPTTSVSFCFAQNTSDTVVEVDNACFPTFCFGEAKQPDTTGDIESTQTSSCAGFSFGFGNVAECTQRTITPAWGQSSAFQHDDAQSVPPCDMTVQAPTPGACSDNVMFGSPVFDQAEQTSSPAASLLEVVDRCNQTAPSPATSLSFAPPNDKHPVEALTSPSFGFPHIHSTAGPHTQLPGSQTDATPVAEDSITLAPGVTADIAKPNGLAAQRISDASMSTCTDVSFAGFGKQPSKQESQPALQADSPPIHEQTPGVSESAAMSFAGFGMQPSKPEASECASFAGFALDCPMPEASTADGPECSISMAGIKQSCQQGMQQDAASTSPAPSASFAHMAVPNSTGSAAQSFSFALGKPGRESQGMAGSKEEGSQEQQNCKQRLSVAASATLRHDCKIDLTINEQSSPSQAAAESFAFMHGTRGNNAQEAGITSPTKPFGNLVVNSQAMLHQRTAPEPHAYSPGDSSNFSDSQFDDKENQQVECHAIPFKQLNTKLEVVDPQAAAKQQDKMQLQPTAYQTMAQSAATKQQCIDQLSMPALAPVQLAVNNVVQGGMSAVGDEQHAIKATGIVVLAEPVHPKKGKPGNWQQPGGDVTSKEPLKPCNKAVIAPAPHVELDWRRNLASYADSKKPSAIGKFDSRPNVDLTPDSNGAANKDVAPLQEVQNKKPTPYTVASSCHSSKTPGGSAVPQSSWHGFQLALNGKPGATGDMHSAAAGQHRRSMQVSATRHASSGGASRLSLTTKAIHASQLIQLQPVKEGDSQGAVSLDSGGFGSKITLAAATKSKLKAASPHASSSPCELCSSAPGSRTQSPQHVRARSASMTGGPSLALERRLEMEFESVVQDGSESDSGESTNQSCSFQGCAVRKQPNACSPTFPQQKLAANRSDVASTINPAHVMDSTDIVMFGSPEVLLGSPAGDNLHAMGIHTDAAELGNAGHQVAYPDGGTASGIESIQDSAPEQDAEESCLLPEGRDLEALICWAETVLGSHAAIPQVVGPPAPPPTPASVAGLPAITAGLPINSSSHAQTAVPAAGLRNASTQVTPLTARCQQIDLSHSSPGQHDLATSPMQQMSQMSTPVSGRPIHYQTPQASDQGTGWARIESDYQEARICSVALNASTPEVLSGGQTPVFGGDVADARKARRGVKHRLGTLRQPIQGGFDVTHGVQQTAMSGNQDLEQVVGQQDVHMAGLPQGAQDLVTDAEALNTWAVQSVGLLSELRLEQVRRLQRGCVRSSLEITREGVRWEDVQQLLNKAVEAAAQCPLPATPATPTVRSASTATSQQQQNVPRCCEAQASASQGIIADTEMPTRAGPPPPPPPPPRPPPPKQSATSLNKSGNQSKDPAATPNSTVSAPPPPPPPPGMVRVTPTKQQRQRLKMLHWDKLANVGPGSIWGQLKDVGAHFNAQELESLFGLVSSQPLQRLQGLCHSREKRFLGSQKAHNLAITLSGLKITWQQLVTGITSMQLPEPGLSIEQMRALGRWGVPTEEEAASITAYINERTASHPGQSPVEGLGIAEQYIAQVTMQVPRYSMRLACLVFMQGLQGNVEDVQMLVNLMTRPCAALRNSNALRLLLGQVLAVGNHLNAGTTRGAADGFRLESLLRLADMKSSNVCASTVTATTSSATATTSQAASKQTPCSGVTSTTTSDMGTVVSITSRFSQPNSTVTVVSGRSGQQQQQQQQQGTVKSSAATAKESLLQFVVRSLLAHSPAVAELPQQLDSLKAAATVQVSCITSLVAELQAGFQMLCAHAAESAEALSEASKINHTTATATSTAVSAAEGGQTFGGVKLRAMKQAPQVPRMHTMRDEYVGAAIEDIDTLSSFVAVVKEFVVEQEETIKNLSILEAQVFEELQALCSYFSEEYDPKDPARILGVVHRFLQDFSKALASVQPSKPAQKRWSATQSNLTTKPSENDQAAQSQCHSGASIAACSTASTASSSKAGSREKQLHASSDQHAVSDTTRSQHAAALETVPVSPAVSQSSETASSGKGLRAVPVSPAGTSPSWVIRARASIQSGKSLCETTPCSSDYQQQPIGKQ